MVSLMNVHIRSFGWLLLIAGSVLTLLGIMALLGLIHVQIDAIGVNLDTTQERIAWIGSWLVIVISGGLLLGLTRPQHH